MPNLVPYVIFPLFICILYALAHMALYLYIKSVFSLSSRVRLWVKVSMVFSLVVLISHTFLRPLVKMAVISFYAGTWLGIISISCFVFFIHFLLTRVSLFRRFSGGLAVGALAAIAAISFYSLINAARLPVVKHLDIPLKRLPSSYHGFTIVHLADLHLEIYSSSSRLRGIVGRVMDLKPDLIVITGDLLDSDISRDPGLRSELSRLKAKHGVFAVTGNHEYYADMDAFLRTCESTGIRVLRNETVTIGGVLQVVGWEDDEAERFGFLRPSLSQVLGGLDTKKHTILLYHRPTDFDEAVKRGVGLQLSGHTHAGQIPPMDILVWLFYKYPSGLYKNHRSYIYTTAGTGVWRTTMRFLSENEIACITLVSPSAQSSKKSPTPRQKNINDEILVKNTRR